MQVPLGLNTVLLLAVASLVIAAPVAAATADSLPFLAVWLLLALAIFACLVLARLLCLRVPTSRARHAVARSSSIADVLCPSWSVPSIAVHAAVMFAFWVPYLVAFAPATMGYDTFYQIFQFFPDHGPTLLIPWEPSQSWIPNRFCDHHPVFDTLIFGGAAYASEALSGSWNLGLLTLAVLQMLAMTSSFSTACAYASRLKAGPVIRLAAYAFFCLCPIVAFYSVTIIKDTFFSWVFVLYFLVVAEAVITRGGAFSNRRLLVAFVVLSVLLCLVKKTGVYVVIVECVVLLAFCRGHRVAVGATALSCTLVMFAVAAASIREPSGSIKFPAKFLD